MNPDTARSTREPETEDLCSHGRDSWFDRTLCEEPCGEMHTRCADCGIALGHGCRWEQGEKRPSVLAIEAELRRSLAAKVRTLPWNVAGQATAPIGGCDEEWAVGEYQSAVLALIEGTDPASPEDDEEGIKADIRQASMGGPDFTPATWPEEHQHEPYCLTCDASLPATPPAGSTIPPLDVAWAAAAAALPKGWDGPRMLPIGVRGHVSRWVASAIAHSEAARGPNPWIIDGTGPTPAAALQALAARLAGSVVTEEPNWRKAHEEAGGDGHTGEYE